jgi:hypothetical protein
MSCEQAGLGKSVKVEGGGAILKERAEPRPGGGSDEAERDGEKGENGERQRHHQRAFVRRLVAAPVAEENVADLARHVERGEQRAEDEHIKRALETLQCCAASRIPSFDQKPEKTSGNPHSANMPMA